MNSELTALAIMDRIQGPLLAQSLSASSWLGFAACEVRVGVDEDYRPETVDVDVDDVSAALAQLLQVLTAGRAAKDVDIEAWRRLERCRMYAQYAAEALDLALEGADG